MIVSNSLSLWFALRVKPRHEKSVSNILALKGYQELLPVYKEKRRWVDRSKEVVLPLFPGYLFCQFNPSERVAIVDTPGVIDIVRTRTELLPVDHEEILSLQQAMDSNLPLESAPQILPGTPVRVVDGPLFGATGLLVEYKNTARLVLTISLLRRSVLVELSRDWVVPVDQSLRPLISAARWPMEPLRKPA